MNTISTIPKLDAAAIGSPITRCGVSFFPTYLFGNPLPEIATGPASGLVIKELVRQANWQDIAGESPVL